MLQTVVHYSMHFVLPAFIAWFFFKDKWVTVYVILIATMLIDLDHLLASPIFDPDRCSVGFHYLHSFWAAGIYILGLFFKKSRVVAIGLVLHLITDGIDCIWMRSLL